MSDNFDKFAEATRVLSSKDKPIRELVYGAYINHLQEIDLNELPPVIWIIYESVRLRLTSVLPAGNFEDDEAGFLANDILYMAGVIQSQKEL
jgi:hypothetical protein